MLLTPHAAVGVMIISKIKNPFFSLPAVLVSHFLSDAVFPHWNPHIFTEIKKNKKISRQSLTFIAADALLALLLTLFLAVKKLPPPSQPALIVLTGGLFSVLPDFFEIPFYFFRSRHPWLLKYVKIHHQAQCDVPLLPGLASQTALTLFCLYLTTP